MTIGLTEFRDSADVRSSLRIGRVKVGRSSAYAASRDDEGWVVLSDRVATIGDALEVALDLESSSLRAEAIQKPEFLCPIKSPSKILGVGRNYLDHVIETDSKRPEKPMIFVKLPNSLNDPYGPIVFDPEITRAVDYEVELAVVIGERTRGVSEEQALSRVFGYTVANDVSARDCQRADVQFDRAKGFDSFCPIGPWITGAWSVGNPQDLTLKCWVNGELRQQASTASMIFSVAHLISYLSRTMTLERGDVILTGTPSGVGLGMDPPRYLSPGDVVECEVEQLGHIRNQVVIFEGR